MRNMISELASSFTGDLQSFVESVYQAIGDSFLGLSLLINVLYMFYYLYIWFYKKEGEIDPYKIIMFMVMFGLLSLIAFDPKQFMSWIYNPLQSLIEGMPMLIANAVSKGKGTSVFKDLSDITGQICDLINTQYENIGFSITSPLSGISLMIFCLAIWVIYTANFFYVAYQFILANIAGSLLLLAAPIAIPMALYPETRWMVKSMFKGYFSYNLVPCFSIAILALSLHSIRGEVLKLQEVFEQTGDINVFNNMFLIKIIGMGVITHMLLRKSSEISNSLFSGVSSNLPMISLGRLVPKIMRSVGR